jgi:hypothetical protein
MATSTKSGTDATLWQIDRFELIFYNPRHRRWQYFAEQPTTSKNLGNAAPEANESLHRLEIRDLLLTIRSIFTSLVAESPIFSLTESRDIGSIQVEAPPSDVVASEKWLSYLRYLRKTASDEGVPDRHIETLESWIKRPTETQLFSFGEALTVLSLLPILEDWDTWGCFVRAEANGADASPDSFPPSAAATWAEPFSIVELQYSEHDSEPCLGSCLQKGFLKKHVQIEGLCQDLSGPSAKVHHVGKADFFDQRYCKRPTEKEQTLYQCYAHLIDPLFAAPAEYADRRQFVIAYPIASGGRIHFLQIIASSEKSSDTSVSSLWIDWQPIHQALWTPSARAFLQDELLRILVSAFQNEAYNYLSKSNDHDLSVCLLNHIYHLLPVEAALIEKRSVENIDQQSYSYHEYKWIDPANPTAETLFVGSEWKRDTPLGAPDERKYQSIELPGQSVSMFVKRKGTNQAVYELISKHRAIAVVEQQMQYLENLRHALHEESERRENDRRKCAMNVYGFVKDGGPQMRKILREATSQIPVSVLATEITSPISQVGDEFMQPRFRDKKNTFDRFVNQAFPQEGPDQMLSTVQTIAKPSLTLLLSEYFDTGPVKLRTHRYREANKLIACPAEEAMEYTDRLHKTISGQLEELSRGVSQMGLESKICLHDSGNDLLSQFDSFHADLINSRIDMRELSRRRKEFAIKRFFLGADRYIEIASRNGKIGTDGGAAESIKPFEAHSRLFGICPCCLLVDFIHRYEIDISSEPCTASGSFKHIRHLDEKVHYSSIYHREADQFQTRLVEHLMFLPYAIDNETEWQSGELAKLWAFTGETIASLYTYSDQNNTPDAKLLLVDPKHKLDSRLVASPTKSRAFRDLLKGESPVSYLVIELQHWWLDDNDN